MQQRAGGQTRSRAGPEERACIACGKDACQNSRQPWRAMGCSRPRRLSRARPSGPAARAQAWRLQQWVQHRVDEQLRGLALLARPVVGFHVRHGDKVAEDQALVRAHC